MMTRPPVSMWPVTEGVYKGCGEIISIVNPTKQRRTINTAAKSGAKAVFLYYAQAVEIYEQQRTCERPIEATPGSMIQYGECCRNCRHYTATYTRLRTGYFRELKEGKCHRKSVSGAKTKATSTCEAFQR